MEYRQCGRVARNEEQLIKNLGAPGWNLTLAQVENRDAASAPTPAAA